MKEDSVFYVGVDVSKAKHAVAIAEDMSVSEALKARGYSDHDIERLPVGELIVCMQDGWSRTSSRRI